MLGLAFILFLFRKKISIIIENYINNKKNNTIKKISPDFVYTPVESSRTFNFTLKIDEIGDGKATISVVKNKA